MCAFLPLYSNVHAIITVCVEEARQTKCTQNLVTSIHITKFGQPRRDDCSEVWPLGRTPAWRRREETQA